MHRHPELGFAVDGQDLEAPSYYSGAMLEFGRASTLPATAYRSKIFSDLEDEKIWTRQWVAIGTTTQLPDAFDMLPYTVGNHGIHVQRLGDGGLIGRFNKAQHGGCRFVPLQCQTGTKTKCSYTSCGYSRDRDVIAANELGEGLPLMRHYIGDYPERLLPVHVATSGPILFVNLDQRAGDLDEQLGDLPAPVAAFFASDIRDAGGLWSEHRCNWKLAGSAILDHTSVPGAGAAVRAGEAGADSASYTMERIALPAARGTGSTDSGPTLGGPTLGGPTLGGQAALCWLFPNLVLAIMPDHAVSIVLQPTSLSSCLTRVRLFLPAAAPAQGDPRPADLLQEWRDSIAAACAKAAERQELMEKWGTPALPETSEEAMPGEDSRHAYRFHRYLVDRILTKYAYVWNAPLYAASAR